MRLARMEGGGCFSSLQTSPESRWEVCSCGSGGWEDREIVLELSRGLGEKFVSEKLVGLLRLTHPRVTGVSI